MLKYEDHCCSCAVPGYPCLGSSCPYVNVPVYYCDECDPGCDEPLENVYEIDGEELCYDCLLNKFKRVCCDHCKDEIDGAVYEVDDEKLCEYCLTEMFRRED